jgi:outer membrane lipoprotein-sorting protein
MIARKFGLIVAALFLVMMFVPQAAIAEEDAGAQAVGQAPPAPPAAREKLDAAKVDVLLADIAKARKEVKTLRASIKQERRITLLAATVKSTGELLFAAPDRLRWDLAAPDDVVYFVGPEGLSYKTKTSSSSTTVPAKAAGGANVGRALGDLRALLGGDLGLLRDRYVLEASRGATDVEIAGTAKPDAAAKTSVRAFTLVLDGKGFVIPIRARLIEGKTDSIDLTFSNVVINAPIDPSRLRL